MTEVIEFHQEKVSPRCLGFDLQPVVISQSSIKPCVGNRSGMDFPVAEPGVGLTGLQAFLQHRQQREDVKPQQAPLMQVAPLRTADEAHRPPDVELGSKENLLPEGYASLLEQLKELERMQGIGTGAAAEQELTARLKQQVKLEHASLEDGVAMKSRQDLVVCTEDMKPRVVAKVSSDVIMLSAKSTDGEDTVQHIVKKEVEKGGEFLSVNASKTVSGDVEMLSAKSPKKAAGEPVPAAKPEASLPEPVTHQTAKERIRQLLSAPRRKG